jgi:glycyl-tRNA synthetase
MAMHVARRSTGTPTAPRLWDPSAPYRHYAQKQGLRQAVAEAIFEAALPRQAGDVLPSSPAGIAVAVADRLDSLVGLVAAVGAPSATADPYGLRRAAYGMLQVGAGRPGGWARGRFLTGDQGSPAERAVVGWG